MKYQENCKEYEFLSDFQYSKFEFAFQFLNIAIGRNILTKKQKTMQQ